MSNQYGPRIVTNGLVLCLDAGNTKSYPGSGTVWTDLSGNANNGTLTNGPTYNSANKGGIVFDGVNDFVLSNNNINISGTNARSLCLWARPTVLNAGILYSFIRIGQINSTLRLFEMLVTSTDMVAHFWGTGAFGRTHGQDLLNKFSYFVLTSSATTVSMYVNGTYIGQGGANINTTNSPVTIAQRGFGGHANFTGTIPLVQVYNRALSASEVLQNYNATKGRFEL